MPPLTLRFDVDDFSLRDSFLRTFFFGALDGLGPDHQARWGRMTAPQMVEHLLWAFEVSTGQVETQCPIPEAKLPRMKAFLYHNRPTPQDFMNPALESGLPALRFATLREATAALLVEIDRFIVHARTRPDAIHIHPVFGPIGVEEWSRSHFKHAAHHLLQFGLIEVEP